MQILHPHIRQQLFFRTPPFQCQERHQHSLPEEIVNGKSPLSLHHSRTLNRKSNLMTQLIVLFWHFFYWDGEITITLTKFPFVCLFLKFFFHVIWTCDVVLMHTLDVRLQMYNHSFLVPHLWSVRHQESQLKASLEQQTSQALHEYFTGSPSCYLSDPRSTVSPTLPLWPTSHWRSSQPFREAIKASVCGYLGCMHIGLAATKSHWLQPCTATTTLNSAGNCQRRLDAVASC